MQNLVIHVELASKLNVFQGFLTTKPSYESQYCLLRIKVLIEACLKLFVFTLLKFNDKCSKTFKNLDSYEFLMWRFQKIE